MIWIRLVCDLNEIYATLNLVHEGLPVGRPRHIHKTALFSSRATRYPGCRRMLDRCCLGISCAHGIVAPDGRGQEKNSRNADGKLVNLGNFDAEGANVHRWKPGNANDNLGLVFS